MILNAEYKERKTNENKELELTFIVRDIHDVLKSEELKKVPYRLNLTEIKSKRTIDQNKLLWSLIHDISLSRNGALATSEDDWQIYLEALEKAQAKFEYVACLPEAYPLLETQFRASKIMNEFEHNGKTFVQAKVFYGSSKMDVKEMAKLLDTVIIMAQEEGVEIYG